MESISLKMDKRLLQAIDKAIINNNYSTRTEFIRESIRNKLTELEKQEAIRKLKDNLGFARKAKQTTDKQLRKTREELSKEYIEKWGLE